MNTIRLPITGAILLFGTFACHHTAKADDLDVAKLDSKRISDVKDSSSLAASTSRALIAAVFHQAASSEALKGMQLDPASLRPLIWQAYVWLKYDLCEEAIVLGRFKAPNEALFFLARATRSPYKQGNEQWRIEWSPSEVIDGTQQFEWAILADETLKVPGAVLKWCYERQCFERIEEVGSPLLQRWVFADNWKASLGRPITDTERTILESSRTPTLVNVPLQEHKPIRR